MIAKSDAASIFLGTQGSRSIEISVPGAFTAVGFSGQQKNPGASAAERGRPSLFKTIDEDRRERHDHINRSGRSTYPGRISVLTSGATPPFLAVILTVTTRHRIIEPDFSAKRRTRSQAPRYPDRDGDQPQRRGDQSDTVRLNHLGAAQSDQQDWRRSGRLVSETRSRISGKSRFSPLRINRLQS
jgi:hypothetical protein